MHKFIQRKFNISCRNFIQVINFNYTNQQISWFTSLIIFFFLNFTIVYARVIINLLDWNYLKITRFYLLIGK